MVAFRALDTACADEAVSCLAMLLRREDVASCARFGAAEALTLARPGLSRGLLAEALGAAVAARETAGLSKPLRKAVDALVAAASPGGAEKESIFSV